MRYELKIYLIDNMINQKRLVNTFTRENDPGSILYHYRQFEKDYFDYKAKNNPIILKAKKTVIDSNHNTIKGFILYNSNPSAFVQHLYEYTFEF